MLKLSNVSAGYDGMDVIHDINLQITSERITALIGPNGCGKSTLLKVLTGIVKKTAGDILLDDRAIEQYKQRDLAKYIACLPQSRNVPEISVFRMVLHGRFPYLKYPKQYSKKDIDIAWESLKQVGMEKYADENVSKLSGGMQQKVYIAMALAQDTPIILLDEPTTFLDIAYQLKLKDMAKMLAEKGKAVVLVLHDIAMALKEADDIVVMSSGKIESVGTAEQIYESGVLDRVFDVKIKRIKTDDGFQYYY